MVKKTEAKISKPQSLRVLMVEDSEDDVLLIIRELKKGGYNPVYERVETATAMKKAFKEKQWDIILCDYKLPKFSGEQAIVLLKETNIDIPLIIVSGTIGEETAVECMRSGAHDYIMKNSLSRLCPAIARELEEAEVRNKHRQAENALRESEEKYRNLIERATDGIGIAQDGVLRYANERLARISGYSVVESIGKLFIDFFMPEEVPKVLDRYKRRMAGEKVTPVYETSLKCKDGSRIDVEVNAGIITYEGEKADLVFIRDITERRRAEEELKKSEKNFRSSLDDSPLGVRIVSAEGETIYVNQVVLDIYGYDSMEEINRIPVKERYTPQSYAEYKIRKEKRERGELGPPEYEINIVRKNGKVRHLLAFRKEILWNGVKKAQIIYQDITERKLVAKKLMDSEEKFRMLAESSSFAIMMHQGDHWIYANRAAEEISGYSEEELCSMHFWDIVHPDHRNMIKERGHNRQQGKVLPRAYEFKIITKNGVEKWVSLTGNPIRYEDKPTALISVTDITERKQAEEDMKERQRTLDTLISNLPGFVYRCANDRDWTMKYISNGCREVTGYGPDDFVENKILCFNDIVHPDFREILWEKWQDLLKKKMPFEEEYPIITKDGETRWVWERGTGVFSEDDQLLFLEGFITDITKRKQAEKSMLDSEVRYRTIFENTGTSMILIEEDMTITMANREFVRNTGYSLSEIIGRMKWTEIVHPDDLGRMVEQRRLRSERQGGALPGYEFRYRTKTGDLRDVLLNIQLVSGTKKSVASLIDITERKRAEKELLKSEEKYRSLVENSQEGIFQSTADGHHITVNQAFANILGYESPEEVMATIADIPHQIYVHPEDRTKILQIIEKEGSVKGYETEFYKKDGSKTWVSINMHAVRDEAGRLLYYQGIDQDIMGKKNMETERQENMERLRKSLEATINAMAVTVEMRDPYTAGHQRRVADLACAIAAEMNLKSKQIDGARMTSMIHDIGKISIPSEILSKPTKLSNLEFDLIKTHSQLGHDILKDIEFPWPVADVVLQHHERMNGSGYPHGLKGDGISLEARILAVADVVEAIASNRPYRPALGIDFALEEISRNKGILYDADAVDACLKLFREKGYTLVQ